MEIKRINYSNDDAEYRLDGRLHRPNGPARIWQRWGNASWWLYGRMHRYYGPYNADRKWIIHGTIIK